MFEKNYVLCVFYLLCVFRVMCMLQTQSVTLFFLYFYYPHEPENGNIYNKE